MLSPGQVLRIEGDMDVLAAHADRVAAAGAGIDRTGADVHQTWQSLAAVYVAPEASQLLDVTGPVATVSASVGEDCSGAAAALHRYAAEVTEIQAGLDAVRTQALDLLDAAAARPFGESDPALFTHDAAVRTELAGLIARWEQAQQRCAGDLRALTRSERAVPSVAASATASSAQFSPARFGSQAPPPPDSTAGDGGDFWASAGAVGSFLLDLFDSTINAAIEHPGLALQLIVGEASIAAGVLGEIAGLVLDVSGVGLPEGLALNAASVEPILAGLDIARPAADALTTAALADLAAKHRSGTAAAPVSGGSTIPAAPAAPDPAATPPPSTPEARRVAAQRAILDDAGNKPELPAVAATCGRSRARSSTGSQQACGKISASRTESSSNLEKVYWRSGRSVRRRGSSTAHSVRQAQKVCPRRRRSTCSTYRD